MVNVHNSKTCTLRNKDPTLQKIYSTWLGDDVICFAPAVRGGQIGVATSMPGPPSHKTRLKTAL